MTKIYGYLWLNICNLAPRELKFVQRNLGLFKVPQESKFFWPEKEQGMAFATFATGCTSDAVNVFLEKLNDYNNEL